LQIINGVIVFVLAFCCIPIFGKAPSDSIVSIQSTQDNARTIAKKWSGISIRQSIGLYITAANDWQRAGVLSESAECRRRAALLLLMFSEYGAARSELARALILDKRSNSVAGETITLSILSRLANQAGETHQSYEYYKRAISLSASTESGEAKANAFFSAAEYGLYFGSMTETIALYERALESATKANSQLIPMIMLGLGYARLRQGEPVIGLQNAESALEVWEELSDDRGIAMGYFALGFFHSIMGQKQTGLDYYRKADAMFPTDVDWLEHAKVLNGIGTTLQEYGDLQASKVDRERAIQLYEKARYPYGVLATLPSLALISSRSGDLANAKELYFRILSIANKSKDLFHIALARQGLADLFMDAGEFDTAIQSYDASLVIYKKLGIILPAIFESMGNLYMQKGDNVKARLYFQKAREQSEHTNDIVPIAESYFSLAELDLRDGLFDRAMEDITKSIAVTESLYFQVRYSSLRSRYLSNSFDRYDLLVGLLMRQHAESPNGDFAFKALQAVERSRARSMFENILLSEADFTRDAAPEILSREKEIRVLLNARADKLTDLLSQHASGTEIEEVSAEIHTFEKDLEEIKSNLRESSPIYSAINDPPAFDVDAFRRDVMDENSVLLEYSLGREESYLWLVDKGGVTSFVLPAGEEIEQRAENLRVNLKTREPQGGESIADYRARVAKAEVEYWREAHQLSSVLLGPVADRLQGKRLIVVPDGKLLYFPISALPFPGVDRDEPLVLSNEVVYEPSAQTLALLARSRGADSGAGKDLLIFSDPVFSLDDPRLVGREGAASKPVRDSDSADRFRFVESLKNLQRLPGSGTEASAVTNSLGGATDSFSGFAATRERLMSTDLADYKIIHFATHALTDENRPELSGVVLSRYDEGGRPQNEFVRLNDIYGMNLKADLVVLSACETGAGKEVKGEGLISLNNAFLQVGAKSVLATVWKAEDGASQTLMKEFYNGIVEGLAPSKALQQAQVKLWKMPQYKSPFFWAAFTLQGDPLARPQVSRAFDRRLYLAGLAPLALLAVYIGWRRRKNYSTAKS